MHWCLCLVLAGAIGPQAGAEHDTLATLEGHVIQRVTGEPIRKVHVTLEFSGTGRDYALVATTDDAGRFRFSEIKPGLYKLTAQKKGFLDGDYGETKPEGGGSLLKISSGDRMQNLTLRLSPGGIIGSRVVDADGDPVPGDEIVLWTRAGAHGGTNNWHIGQNTTTNQSGEYRFDGLSPGTYYVGAAAGTWGYTVRQIPVDNSGKPTTTRDLTTFYPAALSLADAQGVSIEGGQEQLGIDIRIRQGPTLSVKGRIVGDGSVSRYSLSARIQDGAGWTSESAEILPNGEFVFKELPPGRHRLTLLDQGANGFQMIGKTEVNLTDQDLTEVVIAPFKPAQVRVRVVLEGEEDKPLTTGSVFLNPATPGMGDFMNRLLQYQPRSGEQILDPQSIELREGAVLDLLMTLSRNVANLSGDVEAPQDQSKHSVHVLLASEEAEAPSDSSYRWAALDQFLHFTFAHLRPGKYLAFAAQEDDPNLWNNADFVKLLQPEGTELELREKERSTVHLKLITKDQTDRIRKQLGL